MGAHEFVLENLESVPQLEALILLWNSRPVWWTCEELASRLYVPFDRVTGLLRDLVRLQLVAEPGRNRRSSVIIPDQRTRMR